MAWAIWVLAMGAIAYGNVALAQESPGEANPTTPPPALTLFVTVKRNGVVLPEALLEVEQRMAEDGLVETWARPSDLAAVGVRIDDAVRGQEWISLHSIAGLEHVLDAETQSLTLTLSLDRLGTDVQRFEGSRLGHALSPAVRGVALDYDFAGQALGDDWSASTWAQVRTLGGASQLSQSLRHTMGDAFEGRYQDVVRLDTQWVWRNHERMLVVEMGDSVSGGLDWVRPMRFGGVRVGRDFSLQPYRTTNPRLLLSSSAALPSTVEVFLDGVRTEQRDVLPGRFDIGLPLPSGGAGNVRMVVTDINGIAREVDVPLYGSSRLLEKGLTDGSLDLGYLRQEYGVESNRYDSRLFGSAVVRRGLTDQWTMEGHGQWRDGVGVAGVGVVALLPRQWGEAYASSSRRTGDLPDSLAAHTSGAWQHQGGWAREGKRVSVGLNLTRRDTGFFDVVGVLEGQPLPTASDHAWVATSSDWGQWSASYLRQTQAEWDDRPSRTQRVAQVGWSTQWKDMSVSANVQRDLGRGDMSGFLSVSVPLGERQRIQLAHQANSSRHRTNVNWSSPIVGDEPDWGFRSGAGIVDGRRIESSWAQVDRQAKAWDGSAGWSRQAGHDLGWAQVRGSVAWIEGMGPTATRQTGSAFALVETGMAGVPVRLENRPAGMTDQHGRLLVERLQAWQANRISIDTEDLPSDVRLEGNDETFAVPRRSQGARVSFELVRTQAIQGQVKRQATPVAVGSTWAIQNGAGKEQASGMIGNDGMLWADLTGKQAAILVVKTPDGACIAHLPNPLPQADETGTIRLEIIQCSTEELP